MDSIRYRPFVMDAGHTALAEIDGFKLFLNTADEAAIRQGWGSALIKVIRRIEPDWSEHSTRVTPLGPRAYSRPVQPPSRPQPIGVDAYGMSDAYAACMRRRFNDYVRYTNQQERRHK